MDAHVDFLRYEEFVKSCEISYMLGRKERTCLLERKGGDIDLHSYFSIWHRRPGTIAGGKFVEQWISQMVEMEGRAALDGMLRSLGSCLWMNFPANDIVSFSKLAQLKAAEELGFAIPETLVTNKPELVRRFFDECNGEVIYKLMGQNTSAAIPVTEVPGGIATLPLRQEDLPFLDQVTHAPHMFQRYVKKKFDLRVTVVGNEIFCISIDSQSGRSKVDWRNDYSVEMTPFELPADIKEKCFALLRRFGLNYGAIDLILREDDEVVFIEINCAGQYLWIESRTPLQISLAIARLLAGQSEPLVAGPNQLITHGQVLQPHAN
jgi:glutathione synthase/RimK-type ligase-like ATP-grasp enzyme